LEPSTPEPLLRLVNRLIHPDPELRPSNAHEVLDALSELRIPSNVTRHLGGLVGELRAPWALSDNGEFTADEVRTLAHRLRAV
jgi:hypothetical protein